MALGQKETIAEQVGDIGRRFGYKTEFGHKTSPSRFWGLFRDRKYVPDILLKRGGRTAIVEVKTRPVVTYDIFQMAQMRGDSDLAALICAPDPEYYRIAPSVRVYAEDVGVEVCSFSGLDDALSNLLGRM